MKTTTRSGLCAALALTITLYMAGTAWATKLTPTASGLSGSSGNATTKTAGPYQDESGLFYFAARTQFSVKGLAPNTPYQFVVGDFSNGGVDTVLFTTDDRGQASMSFDWSDYCTGWHGPLRPGPFIYRVVDSASNTVLQSEAISSP